MSAAASFRLGADFSTVSKQKKGASETLPGNQKLQLPDGFFLSVGTIEPRKNHAFLLDAFDRLWSQGSKSSLLIQQVGKGNYNRMAELDVGRFNQRLGKLHAHFVKHK